MSEAPEKSLPQGWCWAKFSQTCEPVSDGGRKIPQKAYLENGQFPVIDQGASFAGGFTNDESKLFRGQLPVIIFGDHTRRFKFVHFPFAAGADGVKLIAPSAAWNPKCVWRFLQALKFEDRGYSRHFQFVRASSLPLPPLNEQARIVDALDELLSDVDAGVASLERVQAKLKDYRAAVLKAAVEGALTAEWREQHPATEPASALLARILAERRRSWEEAQLRKFKDAGKTPPKDWDAKYRDPTPPDTTNLPQLAKGWVWASLDQLADIVGGVTKGQKLSANKKLRQVAYLRVANVQRGYLDLREIKKIMATEDDIESLALKVGDVLFNEGGDRDKLGRGWIWEGQVGECIHQNHVFRARLISREIQPKLVSWSGNSYGQRWFMRTGKQSVNLASINLTVLRSFPVPLAPAPEQGAIVEAVEDQLSVIDHLEADLEANLKSAQGLRQSILRHAFEGKLVPQDPNDEPAAELLKRIAAEREARARQAKAAKQTRTKPQTPRRRAAKS